MVTAIHNPRLQLQMMLSDSQTQWGQSLLLVAHQTAIRMTHQALLRKGIKIADRVPTQVLLKFLLLIPPRFCTLGPPIGLPCWRSLIMSNLILQGFNKEVRVRLRSECPRPDLARKVSDTPEVDPAMVNFMKKWAKDPKKGLDRAWQSCQDKLLDMSGLLTQILEIGLQAKESAVEPDILIGWAQCTVCLLGNTNVAMSTERRRSLLMRIDPKLNDLGPYLYFLTQNCANAV
ncbi:hypothetical protein NDU88_008714 [Pleurodeles waltl]|uniref:Uncharacterized protein n=1 Tax=Pleurodeles waltl TaxID=8319 RepID=A0AAV7NAI6_PLEWA|nr:hypothetical protein NDU88_008714 [Pleurodeles waltl]